MAGMRRPKEPVKVRAWAHTGGQLVNADELTPEQKRELGTWLKTTWLNNLYAGRAAFFPADTKDGG